MIAVNAELVGRMVLVHDSSRKARQAHARVLREMRQATVSKWSRTVATDPVKLAVSGRLP
eukprot:6327317-Amphidinium_carterae.1